MEFQEIKKIVELMDKHGLTEFELERDGNKITLKKGPDGSLGAVAPQGPFAALPPYNPAVPPTTAPAAAPAPGGADPADEADDSVQIKSPMVGTLYHKPSPDSPPFVRVGDKIEEDTVVCIVEAMKVMNEIKAEIRGTIARILVDDSTPVEYGEPLFEIKPA